MPSRLIYAFASLLLVAGATFAFATIQSDEGPLASSTGAPAVAGVPAEWDCTLCHFSVNNNLNTPGGGVRVLGLPLHYAPGQTYPLRVRLGTDSTAYAAARNWGFQITAVRLSDGQGVGTFLLPDPDTLTILMGEAGDFASRAYLEQTGLGARTGLGSPVEWRFSWRAPNTDLGPIGFYCAGNAGDGTDDPGNDFIFTTGETTLAANSVAVGREAAARTGLAPPSPNPARGPLTISYSLATRGPIEIAVFDLQGRKVRTLETGWREAGPGRAQWDGTRDDGTMAPNGAYCTRLRVAGEARAIARTVVIRR